MTTLLISCYKDKADIETLTTVSFRNDVVPIVTSGSCGCHNNGVLSLRPHYCDIHKIQRLQ